MSESQAPERKETLAKGEPPPEVPRFLRYEGILPKCSINLIAALSALWLERTESNLDALALGLEREREKGGGKRESKKGGYRGKKGAKERGTKGEIRRAKERGKEWGWERLKTPTFEGPLARQGAQNREVSKILLRVLSVGSQESGRSTKSTTKSGALPVANSRKSNLESPPCPSFPGFGVFSRILPNPQRPWKVGRRG